MNQFSYLDKIQIKDETKEYSINEITVNGNTPKLQVLPATEANKRYFNALLKSTSNAGKRARKKAVTVATFEENRAIDRELYPRHVIQGWSQVINDKGIEVEFTEENCTEFINGLPNWIFDELRDFCTNPLSHSEAMDVEIVAKKS